MRQATPANFRSLFSAFSSSVVIPFLEGLALGAIQRTSGCLQLLLDAKPDRSRKVADQLDYGYWKGSAQAVLARYLQLDAAMKADGDLIEQRFTMDSALNTPQVRFLFCDVFYSFGIGCEDVWLAILGESLTKRDLCNAFVAETGFSACCYCDTNTVRAPHYFEHFLPKSKYPLLAVHGHNLFVACEGCNSPQMGKGQVMRWPNVSPGKCSIGDRCRFSIGSAGIDIRPKDPSDSSTENYIEFLRLRSRYATQSVWQGVAGRTIRVFETFSRLRGQFGLPELLNYHHDMYYDEALLLACRQALIEAYAQSI